MKIIYEIVNKTNGKVYVGQTKRSIDEVWEEILREVKKERSNGRKLFDAIKDEGKDNFHIKEVCQVEDSLAEDKLRNQMRLRNSIENGYNEQERVDIENDDILSLYRECNSNLSEVARRLGCDRKTVTKRLKAMGVQTNTFKSRIKNTDIITCKDNKGFYKEFNSMKEAATWLIEERGIQATDTRNVGCKIKEKIGSNKPCYSLIWNIKQE